jgi:hypothetical protein
MLLFLKCTTYFIVDDLVLLFMSFVELLGHAYVSFLFMRIILLFMFTCRNLLVKSPLYEDLSEKPMMGMFDPFFCRYTNSVRTIETFVESVLATVSERFAIANRFFFFW